MKAASASPTLTPESCCTSPSSCRTDPNLPAPAQLPNPSLGTHRQWQRPSPTRLRQVLACLKVVCSQKVCTP